MTTANSLKTAAAFLQGTLEDKAKAAKAFHQLGLAAHEESNRILASLHFDRAKKMGFKGTIPDAALPDTFDDLVTAADAYLGLEDNQLAKTCLEKAGTLVPNGGVAWFEIARRLARAHDMEGAVAAYRNSIRLLPNVMSYLGLAALYEKTNELKKARTFAEQAIRNFPDPRPHKVVAGCELREGQPEAALARLQAVVERVTEPAERAQFLNLIATAYDKMGQFEEAYDVFQRAKNSQTHTPEYAAANQDYITGGVQLYEALDLAKLPKHKALKGKSEPKQLVFFIGFPRSGTTLVQQIMDAHPNVCSVEERSILTAPLKLLDAMLGDYPNSLTQLTPETTQYLRTYYFLEVAKHARFGPGDVLVDKMPLNMLHLPAILALFPDAKILFGLRHPKGACLSNLMQGFELNPAMASLMSLDDITASYATLMGFWKKTTGARKFNHHFVRYENIVEDFEAEARSLVSFLGLDWTPEILQYRDKARQKGVINTPSYHQVIQPLYKTSLGHWQNYDKFFDPFQKRLAPYMEEFGYNQA